MLQHVSEFPFLLRITSILLYGICILSVVCDEHLGFHPSTTVNMLYEHGCTNFSSLLGFAFRLQIFPEVELLDQISFANTFDS